MKFISKSPEQTKKIAAKIAKKYLGKKRIFALQGELGAGKTTFIQGFAKSLGIKEKIISPTFILIRQHKIPNSNTLVYHIDLYRLENAKEIKMLGLDEILSNPINIVLIEWPEKLSQSLGKNVVWVKIKTLSPIQRAIDVKTLD